MDFAVAIEGRFTCLVSQTSTLSMIDSRTYYLCKQPGKQPDGESESDI